MCFSQFRGSYGIVRRVIDKNFGGQYAAKFLRFGDDETRKELKPELEMLSSLNHQNIVRVVDAYEDRRRFIIVMEMYLYSHLRMVCLPACGLPYVLLLNSLFIYLFVYLSLYFCLFILYVVIYFT